MDIEMRTNTHEDDRSSSHPRSTGRSSAAFPDSAPPNLKLTYEETKRFSSPHPATDTLLLALPAAG